MELYRYTPLDTDQASIRLIHLKRGTTDDLIHCEMFHTLSVTREDDNMSVMPYEALSYTWRTAQEESQAELALSTAGIFPKKGQIEAQEIIFVDNKIMHITRNLYEALFHLRSEQSDRILWIDAICIDQNNLHERGHQVRQMRSIYQNAEEVIVWLGCDSSLAQVALAELPKQLLASKEQNSAESGLRSDAISEGLQILMKSPWFQRVWVIQEIAFARRVSLTYGRATISSTKFLKTVQVLDLSIPDHCGEVFEIMPSSRRQKSSWWQRDRSLIRILTRFKSSKATESRDRIIALLTLCDLPESAWNHLVNYEADETDLVQGTLRCCFPKLSNKGLLSLNWTVAGFLDQLEKTPLVLFFKAINDNGKLNNPSVIEFIEDQLPEGIPEIPELPEKDPQRDQDVTALTDVRDYVKDMEAAIVELANRTHDGIKWPTAWMTDSSTLSPIWTLEILLSSSDVLTTPYSSIKFDRYTSFVERLVTLALDGLRSKVRATELLVDFNSSQRLYMPQEWHNRGLEIFHGQNFLKFLLDAVGGSSGLLVVGSLRLPDHELTNADVLTVLSCVAIQGNRNLVKKILGNTQVVITNRAPHGPVVVDWILKYDHFKAASSLVRLIGSRARLGKSEETIVSLSEIFGHKDTVRLLLDFLFPLEHFGLDKSLP